LCAAAVADLAKRLNVDMPITSTMCDVLSGQITAQQAVQKLMGREPKPEH
jgi:glycerol-3-phosphate dehydrogenase (NAD(P)+)